jgi:hypothetical protein
MDLYRLLTSPLRLVLGDFEREAEQVFPVQGLEDVQERILGTEQAIGRATESIAAHVEVLETLAESLPHLTLAVEQLTIQLTTISTVLNPVADAERRVAGIEHLFGRTQHHGHRDEPTVPPPAAGEPPPFTSS